MKDKTQIIIAALVGALVVAGIFWFTRPTVQTTIMTKDGKEVQVGALAGPDIPSPYIRWGGISTFRGTQSLNQASTTLCSIQSPAATSTLQSGTITFTTGTTTAVILEMGKDNGAAGTTTLIGGRWALAANRLGTFFATTSLSGNGQDQAFVFGPNQYFTVKYGGSSADANVFTGTCNATWDVSI